MPGKNLKAFNSIKWKNELTNSWISDDSLKNSGLFVNSDLRHIDDEFKGSWHGVDYEISEIKLYDEIDYSGIKFNYYLFKGIVIRFKSNKKIKNRTVVTTKRNFTAKNNIARDCIYLSVILLYFCLMLYFFLVYPDFRSLFGIIISAIIFISYSFTSFLKAKFAEPLNKVILEDSKFNKRFNVYSSDQVEARYLVTPSFMERLYNLKTNFGAKVIKCSFFDDCLMIAISTNHDLFEFGDLFHSLLETKSHIKWYKDIASILKMVEYFKLDEKTGL